MDKILKGIGAKLETKTKKGHDTNKITLQCKIFSGPELMCGQNIERDWR